MKEHENKLITEIEELKESFAKTIEKLAKDVRRQEKIMARSDKRQQQEYDELQEKFAEVEALQKEIEDTQKEVVFTMGAIGESRSKETGNHVKRVADYTKLFALYYGLDEREAEMLKQASPMHDIGKVAIPDAVLNKPGRFDEAERIIMNTHAQIGFDMLCMSERELLKTAATVAYEHHEKWDGTGYPRGLKGYDIPIFARIVAIVDVFDALLCKRVYKEPWSHEKVKALLIEERGKHFEEKLVDIALAQFDTYAKLVHKLS